MKTATKKQQIRIDELTKRFGMDENNSRIEKDNDGTYFFHFKSAYGNGYAYIQEDGEVDGNLGYYKPIK